MAFGLAGYITVLLFSQISVFLRKKQLSIGLWLSFIQNLGNTYYNYMQLYTIKRNQFSSTNSGSGFDEHKSTTIGVISCIICK